MNEGFKVFYTTVAINYEGKLIVFDTHCYVSSVSKLPSLIANWNRVGGTKYHYYISRENHLANERSPFMKRISELEYVHG